MNRRQLILSSTALGIAPLAALAGRTAATLAPPAAQAPPLAAPATGSIPVAVLLSEGAVVIDFAGPWEVFESVSVLGRRDAPFTLYTVAETSAPIAASGGLEIVPNYTLQTAPAPKIVVIPAQHGAGEAALEWLRAVSRQSDVTMSVCTGAFVLAATGLLSGKSATTHHNSYTDFAMKFPDIRLIRGARFVEAGSIATSGGLSSGIDLSLRVVERYFGREVALHTADYMEYQGQGWLDPSSNKIYRTRRTSTRGHPLCPVCEMEVDPASAPHSSYKGETYYFCMPAHQAVFDASPAAFVEAVGIT